MEAYHGLVKRLAEALENAGLEYAFTGALAASFYGLPRTTADIDVVVAVISNVDVKSRLVSALKKAGLVVDERKIEVALESDYKIATFKDKETPYRVDVVLSSEKIERRAGTVAGVKAFFQSPEGLILAKLRMIRATVPRERALKDVDDVKAVLNFARVDVGVVKKRARKEGTLGVFEEIVADTG
jgi:hypothetical protein